jgi:hypothetical protein
MVLFVFFPCSLQGQDENRYIHQDSLKNIFYQHAKRWAKKKDSNGNLPLIQYRIIDPSNFFENSFIATIDYPDSTSVKLKFYITDQPSYNYNNSTFHDMWIFRVGNNEIAIALYARNAKGATIFNLTPFENKGKKYYDIDFHAKSDINIGYEKTLGKVHPHSSSSDKSKEQNNLINEYENSIHQDSFAKVFAEIKKFLNPKKDEFSMTNRIIDPFNLFRYSFYAKVPFLDTVETLLTRDFLILTKMPYTFNASIFCHDMWILRCDKNKGTLIMAVCNIHTGVIHYLDFKLTPFRRKNTRYFDIDFVKVSSNPFLDSDLSPATLRPFRLLPDK